MMHARVNPTASAGLAFGSVGWDDDGGTFYELGTDQDDGNILVRVTLFRGRDPSTPLDQTVAQGQKILAKLASNFVSIPPRTTRVLLAMPDGVDRVPGGPMIIAADNANPAIIGNLKDGEAAVCAATGPARALFKKDGTVVLFTQTGSRQSAVVQLNPDGSFAAAGPFGAFASGSGSTQVAFGTDSAGQWDANGVSLIGPKVGLNGGAVSLGAAPTDGIVLQTLLSAQLVLLDAFCGAVGTVIALLSAPPTGGTVAAGPGLPAAVTAVATALTAFTTALGIPNYSLSCKASQ
jgi:hypothetical protein